MPVKYTHFVIAERGHQKMLRSHRGRRRRGGWFQNKLFWSLNEPPRPRLSKERGYFWMARPPLLCQGGEFRSPRRNQMRLLPRIAQSTAMIELYGTPADQRRVAHPRKCS